MSIRRARPPVTVPVLSKSTVLTRARTSSAPPPLTRTPMDAHRETPDMMAMGTARISGQGVATTRTASALTGSPAISPAPPAIASVSGRKASAKRSAMRVIGAFESCAAATRRTIPA